MYTDGTGCDGQGDDGPPIAAYGVAEIDTRALDGSPAGGGAQPCPGSVPVGADRVPLGQLTDQGVDGDVPQYGRLMSCGP